MSDSAEARSGPVIVTKDLRRSFKSRKGVVEAVAGFEIGVRVVRVEDAGVEKSGIEGAGIEEAICGVDHPDGDEHGGGFCPREGEARAAGDEEGPECGDGGGVE